MAIRAHRPGESNLKHFVAGPARLSVMMKEAGDYVRVPHLRQVRTVTGLEGVRRALGWMIGLATKTASALIRRLCEWLSCSTNLCRRYRFTGAAPLWCGQNCLVIPRGVAG